jgi:hypothetical protein
MGFFNEKNMMGHPIDYDDPSTWDRHPTKPWLVVYPPNYVNYRAQEKMLAKPVGTKRPAGESLAKLVKHVLDDKEVALNSLSEDGQVQYVSVKEALVIVAAHKAIKMGDNDMIKWLASMYDTGAGSSVAIKKSLGEAEMAILQKAGIAVAGMTIEHEPQPKTPILDI